MKLQKLNICIHHIHFNFTIVKCYQLEIVYKFKNLLTAVDKTGNEKPNALLCLRNL
jgi:hypothetical protein